MLCKLYIIFNKYIYDVSDPGHHNAHPAEPLQVGQGEADGAVLRRGPGPAVLRGARHQPIQETSHTEAKGKVCPLLGLKMGIR